MSDIWKQIVDFFKSIADSIGSIIGPLFDGKSGGANTSTEGATYGVLYVVGGLLAFGLLVLLLMKIFSRSSNIPENSIVIPLK